MEENKKDNTSIVPFGNNQLNKVNNAIIITNKIIAEFDKRNLISEEKECWIQFRNNIENNGISTNTPPKVGKLKWKFKTDGFIWNSPLIKNGILFFGSEDGNFYSLNASNGELIWKIKTGGNPTGNAIIYHDKIIFCSNKIYAVEMKSGIKQWEINKLPGQIELLSKNAIFIVESNEKSICSIDIETTKINWSIQLYDETSVVSHFSSNDEILFVSLDYLFGYPKLLAIDINTGKILWQFVAESVSSSSTTIFHDIVYFACNEFIYSLDIKIGKLNQKFIVPSRKVHHCYGGSRYSFIIKGNKLYFVKDGYLLYLNIENLKVEVKFKANGQLTAPILIDDTIYFGSVDSFFYAVYLESGIEKWRYKAEKRIFSSPSIANGFLYFGSEDGYLYAIE